MACKFQHSLKIFLFLLLLLGGILLPAKPSFALSYSYQTFPSGNLGIARPDIGISMELSEQILVSSYKMYVNNKLVDAGYDANLSTFKYQPKQDLAPGTYSVKLELQYAGYQTKSITWNFSILSGASTLSTSITAEQRGGLQAINDYRLLLGLPPVVFNNALNTAALKHANYLSVNQIDPIRTGISLHDQSPSKQAYIGRNLIDRINYVGYGNGAAEDVAYKHSTLIEAIDSLYDAPYHRSPFLNPDLVEVGIARDGNYHVIEFGFKESAAAKLTVSPSDGDAFVPTTFDGHEAPDPIRMHKLASYPVGYPLMASINGPGIVKSSLQSASLTDDSDNKITLLQNQSSNDDHLDTEVILIPNKPLSANTIYHASVKLTAIYKDGTTQSFEKDWKFRTESSPGLGSDKLHTDTTNYMLQIGKLSSDHQNTVTFGLDNSYYQLNQQRFPMMIKPFIVDGTSYLYIRDLAAALGATISWDDSRKAAIYTKNNQTVTFFTKRNVYAINGVEYSTGSPAQLVNETTMIPVRLLSFTLGAQVDYVDSTRTVIITY
jgi:uncharacterized protein YkwD